MVLTGTKIGQGDFLLNEAVRKLNDLGLDITARQLRHWDKEGLLQVQTDESHYRRFTYDDIDKAIFIFVLSKVLRISLSRIKNILVCFRSEKEIQEILHRDTLALMSKYRHGDGRERWYLKRELRDDVDAIETSLKKFKDVLRRFDELYHAGKLRLYKETVRYQQLNK